MTDKDLMLAEQPYIARGKEFAEDGMKCRTLLPMLQKTSFQA